MSATTLAPLTAEERQRCTDLLFHEARLLDRRAYAEWLDLLDDEIIYWVPLGETYRDPDAELNIAYDDRTRLEARVERLTSGMAWAQSPPSRTARLVSNVVVVRTASGYASEATFVLYELRNGETQILAGRFLHELVARGGNLKIRRKTIELVTRTEPLFNVSFIL